MNKLLPASRNTLHSSTQVVPYQMPLALSPDSYERLYQHHYILLKIKEVLDEHKLLTSGSTEDIFETVRRLAKQGSMK